MKRSQNFRCLTSLLALSLSASIGLSGCTELANFFSPLFGQEVIEELPQAGSSETVLKKLADHSGEQDLANDMQIVSAEYQIHLTQAEAGDTAVVALPIERKTLPENVKDIQFQPEVWDSVSQTWQATGDLCWYDSQAGKVWFRTRFSLIYPESSNFEIQQARAAKAQKFRVRIYLFSNMRTARREGSQFAIHYYPSHLANRSKVKSDAEWGSPGLNDSAEVPNFIEDLDQALNQAYNKIMTFQSSSGSVFQAPGKQEVYVVNTGTSAGDSRLGGPLRISNQKISNLLDLKLTVAHELVHVFQGQYYSLQGLFTGRYNVWFIEAMANYYAARAAGIGDEAKHNFYGDFFADYLSVPLNASLDNSMYAAGHFLDWLEQRHGSTVVGDAIKMSSGNDLVGLSKAVSNASGDKESLSEAYTEYLSAILTRPEDSAGFHAKVRDAMSNHSLGNGYISSPMLNDKRTFAELKKSLGVYTSVLSSLAFGNSDDALLVMETKGSKGSLLKGLSYTLESNQNKDFANALPIDRYAAPDVSDFVTVPHVGKNQEVKNLNALLINASGASSAVARSKFYLLRPPQITSQSDDELSWSLNTLGNLPKEQIKGFKVYALNERNQRRELLPLQDVKWGQAEQKVKLPTAADMELLVTVLDRWDNEWPADEEPANDEIICKADYKVATYSEGPDSSDMYTHCTGNCLLFNGLTDHFSGAIEDEQFKFSSMWCPANNTYCAWQNDFPNHQNHLSFDMLNKGLSISNLAMTLDTGTGYFSRLNVSGEIPRSQQEGSKVSYELKGEQVCGRVTYSSEKKPHDIVCDTNSYFRLTCEPDYPGRSFSY